MEAMDEDKECINAHSRGTRKKTNLTNTNKNVNNTRNIQPLML
jgi:hypothetical protein